MRSCFQGLLTACWTIGTALQVGSGDDKVALLQLSAEADVTPNLHEQDKRLPIVRWKRKQSPLLNQAVHGNQLKAKVDSSILGIATQPGSEEEQATLRKVLGDALASVEELHQSKHVFDVVSRSKHCVAFLTSGCIYLPTDNAWQSFHEYLGKPYTPLFANMLGNAFYPGCGNTSMSGFSLMRCHNETNISTGHAIMGSHGCFEATEVASVSVRNISIQVYRTNGFVGLPWKWSEHVTRMESMLLLEKESHTDVEQPPSVPDLPVDECATTAYDLPAVPVDWHLTIPLKFVICHAKNLPLISEFMVREQVRWMNEGFAGRQSWAREQFDAREGVAAQVDMQIQFTLVEVQFVQDVDCARFGISAPPFVTKYNVNQSDVLVAGVIHDDVSGVMGMSQVPTQGSPEEMMIIVSAVGLRGYASANPQLRLETVYDEGDTVIHEAGHALGLYHTFAGGCEGDGDFITDTNPEKIAHYDCEMAESCKEGLSDPVRNFMDYTDDRCLMGFTEMQKRRVWCVLEKFRPDLYNASFHQSKSYEA